MHFVKLFCLLISISNFNCVESDSIESLVASYEGIPCTLGGEGHSYEGRCKSFATCPSAVSNLINAGIRPEICVTIQHPTSPTGRTTIVCCESGRRISHEKCEEYHGSLQINSETPTPYVVGGKDAAPEQFPHMVALGYLKGDSKKPSWLCGGTLISDQHVLTAAHCLLLQEKSLRLKSILLGDVHLVEDPDPYASSRDFRAELEIENVIIHPSYSATTKYNDIGIIKLAKKVQFNKGVRPACLPLAVEKYSSNVTAMGWGLLEYGGTLSEVLQYVHLKRSDFKECAKLYAGANNLSKHVLIKSQLCAEPHSDEDGPKDTCEGDSGSGLVVRHQVDKMFPFFVLGVTSFGSKKCGFGNPGVYTNVQAYVDWIEDNVWP